MLNKKNSKTVSIQSKKLRAEAAAEGKLFLSDNENKSYVELELFPFDHGFCLSPHHDSMKSVEIEHDICGRERTEKPTWKLHTERNRLVIHKQIQGWKLSHEIMIGLSGFKIHTLITRPKNKKFPTSLNIFRFAAKSLFKNSKIFRTGGTMGRVAIQELTSIIEGDFSVGLIAVQKQNDACIVFSQPCSDYPLYLGFFNTSWECMVKLPADIDSKTLDLGTTDFIFGQSAQLLLEEFASSTALPAGKIVNAPCAWNSWDYYHSSISYDKIMENARAIAESPVLKNQIEYIVLDMGWEIRHGEWEANSHFPGGMERMAKDIIKLGFKPGIWFAPIIIDPECNAFQDDYSFVGENQYGFPDRTYECCGLFGYILDVTTPKGEKYLFELFRKYKAMGYSYFKLDFLRFMMYVHKFSDRSLTNVAIMRKALKIIRKAVGPDAHILGCNLPFEVGPGYCDSCRVSNDVAIFWDSVKRNAVAVSSTYFFNSTWWANDPDFLVTRGKDTYCGKEPIFKTWWFPRNDEFADAKANEYFQNHYNVTVGEYYQNLHNIDRTLSLEEAQTHASLELMLGGAYVLGDPVFYLNRQGSNLYSKVLTAKKTAGKPLNLFEENGLPSTWVQVMNDKTRVGVFNWGEETRKFLFDLDKFNISSKEYTDFWTEENIVLKTNKLTLKLKPHSCKVLEFKNRRN